MYYNTPRCKRVNFIRRSMIFECVLLALPTEYAYASEREYASAAAAAASFFISHSLFFSLVQVILHAAQRQ
jgi:hypothetical protein